MRISILILIMFSVCFSRVKTDTIYIVGLVSGYLPYQSSAGKLVISPIFTNGFNAAVGKATVEMWAGTQRAFQIGGSSAWMGIAAESGSSDFYGLNNLYFDGAWKPYASGTSARFHFGSSGFLFAYDTGVVADVGFTPTNRFSWTLSGGLNVAGKARFDSLQLGGGSYLKTFVEGTLPCTLKTTDVTVQQVGVIKYTVIGNSVTLTFPFIYGTSNSNSLRLYCGGLTGVLDPGVKLYCNVSALVDNGTTSTEGHVVYWHGSGNYFAFLTSGGGTFNSTGAKGIGHWLYTTNVTIQYTK